MESHFESLKVGAAAARNEVVLIAPFVKEAVIEALLTRLSPVVSLCLVTRWRVDEILAGVSDVTVFDVLALRAQLGARTRFLLLDQVHAKYYRFDENVFIGSANLTQTGLGLVGNAVELLLRLPRSGSLDHFETQTISAAYEPTVTQVDMYRALMPDRGICSPASDLEDALGWLPRFRNPSGLWHAYARGDYPSPMKQAALEDVARLGVPMGLPEDAFRRAIRASFGATRIVRQMREFCETPRRFGEVRKLLREQAVTPDETTTTQTVIRWLLEYLPDEFSATAPNYSEIIVYVGGAGEAETSGTLTGS